MENFPEGNCYKLKVISYKLILLSVWNCSGPLSDFQLEIAVGPEISFVYIDF